MKVRAPGKLILSGEHAVVYGQPALAMAVNRYVTTSVSPSLLPRISFDLSDLPHESHFSIEALKHLKSRIKHNYHRFVSGEFSIREVLQKPFELAHFAIGLLSESLQLSLPKGVKIHLNSNIPIGCGLGSSAATILSVMVGISRYLDSPISEDNLFKLALEAEKMQHGYSSGLDLRVSTQGGCLFLDHEQISKRLVPDLPMYLINTGMPISSTGECVTKVAPLFQKGFLASEFGEVTKMMDNALQQQSWKNFEQSIALNHQLLCSIGVVPQKVQTFIKAMEDRDFVAKICGAGAVFGENAGVVLAVARDQNAITALCARFGYNIISIMGESRGVHAL